MKCLAHTEAVIDFGDDDRESDISEDAMIPLHPIIRNILSELKAHLSDGKRGEIIREGVQVAIVGNPNAGNMKANLFHAFQFKHLFLKGNPLY
jgi:tRNA modification GTPase